MPLKRLLDESRAFETEAAALLIEAFNAVVAELDLRSVADREHAAKIIIRLAHAQRSLDAATIRDQAIIEVRKGRRDTPPPAILTIGGFCWGPCFTSRRITSL
jgi:hypothetical protein